MKFQNSLPLRVALTTVALTFAMLQSAAAAEKDCPKGDLPVSATIEGRATTVGWIVGVSRSAFRHQSESQPHQPWRVPRSRW